VLPVVNLNARQKHLNNQEPTPLVRLIIIIIIRKLDEFVLPDIRCGSEAAEKNFMEGAKFGEVSKSWRIRASYQAGFETLFMGYRIDM
jgi:hypothetical protein